MKNSWFIVWFLLGFSVYFPNSFAQELKNLNSLNGQDVLYSSPYLSGAEAEVIKVHNIQQSDDFFDSGHVLVNGESYPIDQLFVKNSDGLYENLAYLFNYDGVGQTFFIRYYDKERLSIKDEILNSKQKVAACVTDYKGSGVESVKRESEAFTKCLDEVFYHIVQLFYANSSESMIQSYQGAADNLEVFYENSASPDFCYGKCGTISQMKAFDNVVKAKRQFILDVLDNLDNLFLSKG